MYLFALLRMINYYLPPILTSFTAQWERVKVLLACLVFTIRDEMEIKIN